MRYLLLACVLAACGSDPIAPMADDDDPPPPPPPPLCEPSLCGDAGCCDDHCCELQASNGDALGDLEPTGLTVAPPAGTFDTDTDCVTPSSLGDCAPVALGDAEVCVCRMDDATIGDLRIAGERALAILAYERIVVGGDVIVVPGAGTARSYTGAATSLSGGAGGTYGTTGGGSAAAAFGTPELVPLAGGMTGQDSCNSRRGGLGGGALQLSAGNELVVLGSISAPGAGGEGGAATGTCLGGAGGGSGGALLLEAPKVIVSGALGAHGGGGGGGGSNGFSGGVSGSFGPLGGNAVGGSGDSGHGCALGGFTSGGSGGGGSGPTTGGSRGGASDSVTGCLGPSIFLGEGGSGGGAGRIRINTETGCQCGGVVSPAPTFGIVVRE